MPNCGADGRRGVAGARVPVGAQPPAPAPCLRCDGGRSDMRSRTTGWRWSST